MAAPLSVPRIIAVFNRAGGVGKSTVTLNLGYHLARRKGRVLLVDLDPQANLTLFSGLRPSEDEPGVWGLLSALDADTGSGMMSSSRPAEGPVSGKEGAGMMSSSTTTPLSTTHGFDLIPASEELAGLDFQAHLFELSILRRRLAPLAAGYSTVLIDCPPSLGLLSTLALVAATHVLVPIQCQYKAYMGTERLLDTVSLIREGTNPALQIMGFLPTMYDARNGADRDTLQALKEQLTPVGQVFDPIPRSTAFVDASVKGEPLAVYKPRHPATTPFEALAKRLLAASR